MRGVGVRPATKELGVYEVPEPRITDPGQVKVRMLEVGVCGTDREIARFDYGTPPAGSDLLIIGHEGLGEVVEIGKNVKSLSPGDLVVPMVRRPCPHPECIACRQGRQDFCYTGDFRERGIKALHGFMTSMVVDEEQYFVHVPADLREIAVLTEPLTIAEKALEQVWEVQQRLPWGCPVEPGRAPGHCRRAVVLGAGPVGLLGALALRMADFEVHIFSRSNDTAGRTRWAESIGANYLAAETLAAKDLEETVGHIDLVYEAVGAAEFAFQVLQEIGPNAVYVFTGIPGRKAPMPANLDFIMRNMVLNNQVLFGTVNAGRSSFDAAIHDLQRFRREWPGAVEALKTGSFSMEEAPGLLRERGGGIKNVVAIGE